MSKSTKHSAIFIAAYIGTALINYAFGVGLSWFFVPEEFGVLGVTQSLLLLIALVVGSGFSWSVARDLASSGVNSHSRARLLSALLVNFSLGVSITGLLWLAYRLDWLPLGPAYRALIPLVGLTTAILAVRAVINGAARGLYKFEAVAVNLLLEVVVKTLVGFGLLLAGLSVKGVLLAFAAGAALSCLHSLWIVRAESLWKLQRPDWKIIPDTLPIFIGVASTALMINLDVLGLKVIAPGDVADQMAGIYQAAVILARTPVYIAQAITLVIFSYIAGAQKQDLGDGREGQGSVLPHLRTATLSWYRMLAPIGLVLVLTSSEVMAIFFPPVYHSSAGLLQVAAIGGILLALLSLLTGVAQAAGRARLAARAVLLAILTQGAVLLLGVPRFGAAGAGLSLICAGIVGLFGLALVFRPEWPALRGWFQFNPGRYLRNLLPLMALGGVLLAAPAGDRWFSLIKFALAALTYLAFLGAGHRPKAEPGLHSRALLSRFVRVLLGG